MRPEILPCSLETGMLGSLERDRLVQANDVSTIDLGQREAGVGAADIGDGDRPAHTGTTAAPTAASASIAASIADAPSSAVSQVVRINANSSRPVPIG